MKIKNVDKLFRKLDEMQRVEVLKPIMGNVGSFVKDSARLLAPEGAGSGDLRDSIDFEVVVKGTKVEAIIFTNKEHGPYVEFGTGPKGQKDHKGISPKVKPKYRVDRWMIPASEMDEKLADTYHFIKIYKGETLMGYLTYGQPAQPFMYPAFKNNKKQVIEQIKDDLRRVLRNVADD